MAERPGRMSQRLAGDFSKPRQMEIEREGPAVGHRIGLSFIR